MNQLILKSLGYALMLFGSGSNVIAEAAEDNKSLVETGVCEKLKGEGEGWMDAAHTFLSVGFCEPSVWFDSFFSDERVDEEERAGTHVRWQNDYILTEGGVWKYVSNVHASFKIPKAKKSLHIVFDGEEEETLQDVVPDNKEEAKGDLGLLYALKESERVNFSVRVKLSPSIIFRYRYEWPVSDTFTTRFTQEWYRRDNADGTISRMDFEKKLYDDFLLRQSNSVLRSEIIQGEEWNNSLVLYQHLTDKSALSYESSMAWVTVPKTYTTSSRLGVRYRKNFYRKWLFYEIAPAMNWSKPLITDERTAIWQILFRLEINFVNL